MRETTLCYILRGDQVLMLHRTKKKNDLNHDKWIGVGGHLEPGETPEVCVLREALEETGLTLTSWRCRGIVTFVSGRGEFEYMHLFTAEAFEGTLSECDEGELAWVPKAEVPSLNLWEGDRIFLDLLLKREDFFLLKLVYDADDRLIEAVLDGKRLF